MVSWLGVLLLVILAMITGVLLALRFIPRGLRWNLPTAFAALALGVIFVGWVALVLAQLGVFSVPALLVALVVPVGFLGLWRWRGAGKGDAADEISSSEDQLARWEWVMLAVWLAAALWLYFRPHEYIFGGADAGVYVLSLIHISEPTRPY